MALQLEFGVAPKTAMPGMIRIRGANMDDAKPLIAMCEYIVDTCYRSFLGDELVDSFIRREALNRYIALHLGYFQLLTLGDEIVGCTVCKENQIDLMMIDPRVAGFGLGTQLLQYSEKRLFRSSPVLGLRSFAGNHQANTFYRKHGWEDMVAHTDRVSQVREILFRKLDPMHVALSGDLTWRLTDSGNWRSC